MRSRSRVSAIANPVSFPSTSETTVRSGRTEVNEQEFVLEGWVLYGSIVVPVLVGVFVCYGRSMFARLLIVAAAIIIIVSVGIGSVYAGLHGHAWEYVPLRIGQYIDFFGGLFLLGTIIGAIWALPSKKP